MNSKLPFFKPVIIGLKFLLRYMYIILYKIEHNVDLISLKFLTVDINIFSTIYQPRVLKIFLTVDINIFSTRGW